MGIFKKCLPVSMPSIIFCPIGGKKILNGWVSKNLGFIFLINGLYIQKYVFLLEFTLIYLLPFRRQQFLKLIALFPFTYKSYEHS